MNLFKTLFLYTKKHYDFLIVDLLTYAIAYYVSILIRRSLDIRITRGDLFLKLGVVSLIIYFIVEITNKNLNGIVSRSTAREARAVIMQMLATWSIYTVILFLFKAAYDFSRALYLTTFVLCCICIIITRTIWKNIVKYTRAQKSLSPRLLIVCDTGHAYKVLMRMLPGYMENQYEISSIVVNTAGETGIPDNYTMITGLDRISDLLAKENIQAAYIELEDAKEEEAVITQLLGNGVMVYRSLGDSKFGYAYQQINEISGKSAISIEDTRESLTSKIDELLEKIKKKKGGH